MRSLFCSGLIWLLCAGGALADGQQPFDLTGPILHVAVSHKGATLPISEVPNLAPGDEVSIKAEFPSGQSVHYLLVAGFLRGATNPPPAKWFFRADTWDKQGHDGLKITVPADARQVIVFLAPQTGGDFAALVNAVRRRPGGFVRASQDLEQASLDRSRLDTFLDAVRKRDPADPDRLKTISPLLARSLAIKLNTDCFQKLSDQQATCLTQGQDALVLSDDHSASLVQALTSGSSADLAAQLSATPQARAGYFSPYLGAVMDIARIMDSFHTAQYQYIPALPTVAGDHIVLLLNTAPSFQNPMSVLVTALPAVQPPADPPLQPVDPKAVYCAQRPDLVLPVEGAPLVYSTLYAHDMMLRLRGADGHSVDLPIRAEADRGGFVVDGGGVAAAGFAESVEATIHGLWGFQPFDGPSFHLQMSAPEPWRLADDDVQSLIAGRDDRVRLEGRRAACVESLALQTPSGDALAVDWKAEAADRLALTLPLTGAQPGAAVLSVRQFGLPQPDKVNLQTFAQAGRLDGFTLNEGAAAGELKGARLDEVRSLTFDGVEFTPGELVSAGGGDVLAMVPVDATALGRFHAGQTGTARVRLKDGQMVRLRTMVAPPRPKVSLIGKSIDVAPGTGPIVIRLTDPDELPQNGVLTFSLRAEPPNRFSGRESVEVAVADGSAATTLNQGQDLVLEDAQVAVATLDAAKAFNGSAFGPLKYRVVVDGMPGDWQSLATLVRRPVLRDLRCAGAGERPCELSGANLFLVEAISNSPTFSRRTKVPEGFPGRAVAVPRPTSGLLYLRLRDDPQVINQAVVQKVSGAAPKSAAKPLDQAP